MPYINLQVTAGVTREQKAEVIREFTAVLQRVLGKQPEHTHIVIQEIDEDNWGYCGMLTTDWKKL
jgi:4-oxalocrotonate tautomerase